MQRRTRSTVALTLSVGVAAAPLAGQSRTAAPAGFAGCYTLSLGAWTPRLVATRATTRSRQLCTSTHYRSSTLAGSCDLTVRTHTAAGFPGRRGGS
jgi:hypothetical protein